MQRGIQRSSALETVRHPELAEREHELTVPADPEATLEPDGSSPIAKLAECDRHLTSIGAEVASLRHELARLREEAQGRDKLLEEREVVIAELSGLLPTIEEERIRARRQAQAASAALTKRETSLREQTARVSKLERELEAFRAAMVERDRAGAELEASLAGAHAKLEDTRRALAEAESRAQAAEPAQLQLEALSAERDNLVVSLREERERAQLQAGEASDMLSTANARLKRESMRTAALERELTTFGAALAQRVGRLADLEAELAETRRQVDTQRSADRSAPGVPAEVRAGHLRFVLVAGGYTLSESGAAPPGQGELVEIEGKRFIAAKIGRSPVPGDGRVCVYLLEEPDLDGDLDGDLGSADLRALESPERSTETHARFGSMTTHAVDPGEPSTAA